MSLAASAFFHNGTDTLFFKLGDYSAGNTDFSWYGYFKKHGGLRAIKICQGKWGNFAVGHRGFVDLVNLQDMIFSGN